MYVVYDLAAHEVVFASVMESIAYAYAEHYSKESSCQVYYDDKYWDKLQKKWG